MPTALVTGATGNSWALHTNCPVPGPVPTSPANNDFKPGFATALMHKDIGLAMDAPWSYVAVVVANVAAAPAQRAVPPERAIAPAAPPATAPPADIATKTRTAAPTREIRGGAWSFEVTSIEVTGGCPGRSNPPLRVVSTWPTTRWDAPARSSGDHTRRRTAAARVWLRCRPRKTML